MDSRASNDAKDEFRALLELPGPDVPLGRLCLLICRMGRRDIDVDEQLALLDADAADLASSVSGFDGVMQHLFRGPNPLRGNTADYYNPANSMLSDVRATRLGIPITLSVMAIELSRRAGVSVHGVGMPGHFLVGSGDDTDLFADPFDEGRLLNGAQARQLFERVSGGKAAWSNSYLRPTATRDIVFRILNNLRVASAKSITSSIDLPWILELISWFPGGPAFDARAVDRAMSRFN